MEVAVELNRISVVKLLLEVKVSPNIDKDSPNIDKDKIPSKTHDDLTPLFDAVRNDYVEIVRVLLDAGAHQDVEVRGCICTCIYIVIYINIYYILYI